MREADRNRQKLNDECEEYRRRMMRVRCKDKLYPWHDERTRTVQQEIMDHALGRSDPYDGMGEAYAVGENLQATAEMFARLCEILLRRRVLDRADLEEILDPFFVEVLEVMQGGGMEIPASANKMMDCENRH